MRISLRSDVALSSYQANPKKGFRFNDIQIQQLCPVHIFLVNSISILRFNKMASIAPPVHSTIFPVRSLKQSVAPSSHCPASWNKQKKRRSLQLVAAVGDLSSDSTTYLLIGAAAITLFGTAFPILFSRKDLCPECDGAGFVRKGGATLRANAARKDQAQIVCPRCNGLGKLNQIDK